MNRMKKTGLMVAAMGALGLGVSSASAALLVDLRVTGSSGAGITVNNNHSVTLASDATGTITVQAVAKVSGADANLTNEGLNFLQGGFQSTNANGGATKGPLTGALGSAWTGDAQSSAGTQNDVDGDGDLDLIGTDPTNQATGWFQGRNTSIPAMDANGEILLETLTYTIGTVNQTAGAADTTTLQYVRRGTATNAGLWKLDGTNTAGNIGATGTAKNFGNDTFTSQGVAIDVAATPEPATLGLLGIAAVAGLRRRRQA